MSETFDPYRKWFGIPPSQQPPHHYRLLGIELFESDVEIIDTAASQRMSYLQELSGGEYVKESQKLLNEVSAARRCLLDVKKKSEYDAGLKTKLAAAAPASPSPATSSVRPPPIDRPAAGRPTGTADEAMRGASEDSAAIRLRTGSLPGKSKTKSDATAKADDSAALKLKKSELKLKSVDPASQKSKQVRGRKRSVVLLGGGLVTTAAVIVAAFVVLKQSGSLTASSGESATPEKLLPPKSSERTVAVPSNQGTPTPTNASTPSASPTTSTPESAVVSVATTTPVVAANVSPTTASTRGIVPLTAADVRGAASGRPTGSAAFDASTAAAGFEKITGQGGTTTTDPKAMFALPPTGTATASAPATAPARTANSNAPVQADAQAGAMFDAFAYTGPTGPLHFASSTGAVREIRGFFRTGDTYHLFFDKLQGTGRNATWNWGHAVSADLFGWSEVPLTIKLVPAMKSELCDVFVDESGDSGFGGANAKPWVACFAYSPADKPKTRALGLAFSTDAGTNWTLFDGNPIIADLPSDARFARIVRDVVPGKNRQLMLVRSEAKQPSKTAPQDPVQSTYLLYTSADLKTWELKKTIPLKGIESALELVPVERGTPAAGERWMVISGEGHLMFADWVNDLFTLRVDRVYRLSGGRGYYGFRTLAGGDPKNLVQLAGVVGATAEKLPTAMLGLALPRKLQVQPPTENGITMIRSLEGPPASWQQPAKSWSNVDLTADAPLKVNDCGTSFRFELQLEGTADAIVDLAIGATQLQLDFKNAQQVHGKASTPLNGSTVQLSGVVDNARQIIELDRPFAGYSALRMNWDVGRSPFALNAKEGRARVVGLKCTPLVGTVVPVAPPAK